MTRGLAALGVVLGLAAPAAAQPMGFLPAPGAALTYIVPAAAGSADGQDGGAADRQALPDMIFADGSGMPQHLVQYRGMVVVLNFWAGWCGLCIKQMQFLDRLQGDMHGQPLAVVAVSEDDGGIAQVRQFLVRQKFTYLRPFADPGASLAQFLGLRGLPTTLIIDRHGRLVQRVEGPYQWESPEIVARLRFLMTEP